MMDKEKWEPITGTTLYFCPTCRALLPQSSAKPDDSGTIWFTCTCGKVSNLKASRKQDRTVAVTVDTTKSYTRSFDRSQFCDANGVYKTALVAEWLFSSQNWKTDKATGILYYGNSETGLWDANGDIWLKIKLRELLGEDNRKHDYNDVKYALECYSYDAVVWSKKLACTNGLIDVETGTFSAQTLDEFILYSLPVDYNKAADCLKIKQFLKEVFGENQQAVVQEAIGYCLLRAMPYHKAVMLIGEGSNGKSTFLNLLAAFLGAQNLSNVSLQDLSNNRFASANLYQKLANISADLPQTAIANSGRFKMLTGGDRVYAEHKHCQPFEFYNTAKLLFSTNKIPEVADDTLAFYRRWIILECNNTFLGDNCKANLLAELITPQELSGLLNYALEGLHRLQQQGHFSVNETIDSLRTEYIRKSNSAKAYVEEQLTFDNSPDAKIAEAELYRQYVLWCNREGLPAVAKAALTKNIQQYLPQSKQTMSRILGKPTHIWQYLKTVTTVTTPLLADRNSVEDSNTNSKLVTPVTHTDETPISLTASNQSIDLRVCGDCTKFHLPSCGIVSGNWATHPADWWAGELRCWVPKLKEAQS